MQIPLVGGVYAPIPPGVDGGIHSDVLGLDFYIRDRRLGIYDPVEGQWLQTPSEAAEARAEQEAITQQKAEAEVECLREQLARLQART